MKQLSVPATLTQAILPDLSVARQVGLVVGFSLITALSAQVTFHLPGNPVPITGQTFGVLLTGAVLGPRLGFLAMLSYLLEGLTGMPVFASASSGWAIMAGPTGGYLVAFPFAAALVGFLATLRWDRRPSTTILSMILGNVIIYAIGVSWLSHFVGNLSTAASLGMTPFLVGDALKIAIAAALLPTSWLLVNRTQAR